MIGLPDIDLMHLTDSASDAVDYVRERGAALAAEERHAAEALAAAQAAAARSSDGM
jgi:hypothetical protein